MAGSETEPTADEFQKQQNRDSGSDVREFLAAANGMAFDTKVMRQAIRLHKRQLATRTSNSGLLNSYIEAVEIGLHESWF